MQACVILYLDFFLGTNKGKESQTFGCTIFILKAVRSFIEKNVEREYPIGI